MARAKAKLSIEEGATASPCEFHGQGGSYIADPETGTRRLVERTEQVIPRSVDEANPEKKDEAATEGAATE